MSYQRMAKMEKHLETFVKLLSFLKKFEEHQDSLTTIMVDLGQAQSAARTPR
jgi:hypothetical protein